MFTGPPLQPRLWDIMVRGRVASNALLVDIQKVFLQVGIHDEDRDAFRFLFNLNGNEEHLRFRRVPFGVEASPFMLGATIEHHLDQQPAEFESTVNELRENTYVDNVMTTRSDCAELVKFRQEATKILEGGMFPLHKWESKAIQSDRSGLCRSVDLQIEEERSRQVLRGYSHFRGI